MTAAYQENRDGYRERTIELTKLLTSLETAFILTGWPSNQKLPVQSECQSSSYASSVLLQILKYLYY